MEISAGGVIYRRRGSAPPQVCLIATQNSQAWQLPKGLIEDGEEPAAAAEREVNEETGLRGALERRLDRIEYWYSRKEAGEPLRIHKFVYFFLFRYLGGATKDHDHEVDDARWFPLDEAQQRLSFEGERRILDLAALAIEESHS